MAELREMTARMDGEKRVLIITIPLLENPQPSASGKTLVVATTHGNVTLAGLQVQGRNVKIGVNAYIAK